MVKEIEFFIDSTYNTLSLRFTDDTSLNFQFATGFDIEAYFSRWKDGNERVVRYWPRIHCQPAF